MNVLLNQFIAKTYAVGDVSVGIGGSHDGSFIGYVTNITNFCIEVVGPIGAVIMFTVAAFLYFTSGGDESKVSKAKEIIIGVVTGYVILIMIRLIATFLVG